LVINLPQNYERGNQSTMGAMPQEPYKQNPRQNGLPEVLFFHGRYRETQRQIVENR
jgi:hypothetical protein